MTDSLFFDLNDILATEEKINADFQLDCFNLDSLDYMSVRLETKDTVNSNKIQNELPENE